VDYIYVYFISRLSRNFEEAQEINQLVLNDTVKVLSKKESLIDCSSLPGKHAFVDLLTEAMFDSKEKSLESIINMDQTYKK
jgi:DNA invertase Pin-like site-specific DNA recombinase